MVISVNIFMRTNRRFVSYLLKSKYVLPKKSSLNEFATAVVTKKVESLIPLYRKTDQDYKTVKRTIIQTLEDLLKIKTFDALDIVLNNKHFQHTCRATLKQNFNLYREEGVDIEVIVKYPELLTVDATDKIQEVKKLPYDINTTVILLLLRKSKLKSFVSSELKLPQDEGKIASLSNSLQISIQHACKCIADKPFLISMSTKKLKENINILLDYCITSENICNDLWVMKYSSDIIKSRLDLAKQYKVESMKTWMVRAQQQTFQNHIQRRSDTKSILGNSSLVEYLSERLECSIDFASYLILKQPSLKNRSLKKLKELIDFLYAEGFKSSQICRVPKILVHSLDTTRRRLKLLEEKNIQIDGLSMLTKSQNQFMQYYEALVKNKNKTKS